MATHTFVHFEDQEAAALAGLTSIRFDLSSTVELCEYLEARCAESEHGYAESALSDAFSTAILVRYSRAFVTGVRQALKNEALASITDIQRANHERFRAFRDKHVAHSVNAFEDTRVQARYCLERLEEEGITGVGAAHYRVVGLSSQDVFDMIDLCKALLIHVDEEIEKEKKRLLGILREIPVSELLSRPSAPILPAQPSKIGKRRAKP